MKKDSDHIKAVPGNGPKRNLPVLLRQTKDNSVSILLAHLENLFSSCDDLFFDLSSRAVSNSEQNLYFESMREVRLKKNGVVAAFKTEIDGGFHHLVDNTTPTKKSNDQDSDSNLSLVQNDELEQDVAITSMVTKARITCQESLYHLNLRFDYLLPDTTVTDNNNPVDPQQICDYFATACNVLDLNIKARIILFKQFDRLVVSKLTTVYSSANNLLIEAGVLPNTREYAKSKSGKNAAPPPFANPAATSTLPDQTQENVELEFAELGRLFSSIRQYSPEVLARAIPNYRPYATNPGPVLNNHELLNLLTASQQSVGQQIPTTDDELKLNSIRNIITGILSNQGNEPERALQQPDDDVINLVAMFFDFVLDDKNLPVPIQALISRLQIPVLKIALHDKAFFSNGGHPTRKLINAIADASIGWDDSSQKEKDKLYELITKITHDINELYEENDDIFTAKYVELEKFIEEVDRKSSLIEKRTGQVAEGQAKTDLAKRMAQKTMFEKLKSASLPENISQFLTEHWLSYMVMTHLKHGDESSEWIDAIQLVDDLAWASQQHTDAKSLERFEKLKPSLLERISDSVEKISTTEEEATAMLADIKKTLDQLHSESAESLPIRPLTTEQAKDLGHIPGSGTKSWKDMTGVERQQARYKQLTYDFIRKAEELPLHTWLSYADNKTGKITRCKLASRIEQTDTYIFVNRYGFKALEKQRKDFAVDLQAGRAAILDRGQLFDRALSGVLGKLSHVGNDSDSK